MSHRKHISGHEVFLSDKGWMSDAPLKEWMGITVDGESGRVTEVNLRGKGLVGPVPRALADLSSLEALDLIGNPQVEQPAGLKELGLLDLVGEIHYTTTAADGGKDRTQSFLRHLKLPDAERQAAVQAAQLVARHGPDGPALRQFYDANGGFPHWEAAAGKVRWFEEKGLDISKWFGVTCDADTRRVTGLELKGMGFTTTFSGDGLARLPALLTLDLNGCSSLVSLPDRIGDCTSLQTLNLYNCSSLMSLPDLSQLVAAGLKILGR
jgi:hypothetical protein